MEKEKESVGLFDFKGDWFLDTLINELAKRKPLEEYKEGEIKEITITVLRGVIPDMAKDILGTLEKGMPDKLKERRAEKAEFEEHVRRVWGKPLDLLEIFISTRDQP
jgi:septum formation inhibitor-activating ATPase MinD